MTHATFRWASLKRPIPVSVLRALYRGMVRIRRFEEALVPVIGTEIRCPTHLYTGQEAVAVGVCASLSMEDKVLSTHRSHGHYLAKGGDMRTLMAEMYGKGTGCSGGYGGSMHLASPEVGLLGSPIIVGSCVPLAVGAGLAAKVSGKRSISVVFFGEGATNEGVVLESLNFAALLKLPVVFICENNLFATHLRVTECLAEPRIYLKALAMGVPARRIDGNNVETVYRFAKEAVRQARRGRGPALLECMTYRWRGHVGPKSDVGERLRTQEELSKWMRKCPIQQLERKLLEEGALTPAHQVAVARKVDAEIAASFDFARKAAPPDPALMGGMLFSPEGSRR